MALIHFVTSLTGAFMGNFVDFQSDFFHFSSYSQVSFLLSICFLSFFERTHRHKNFNSLLPYIVFLKLSLWASLHELAIVQAIVFRQRVSFSFLWKCMWIQIWIFMHETYFWRIIGPNYWKCTLMYPYFIVLFVARKLFKKWHQPWFPFARAWFFKMHLRFLWYLSAVMWQHLIFHIFVYETSLFCYHGVFFGLVLCFCSKSSYWLACCYC